MIDQHGVAHAPYQHGWVLVHWVDITSYEHPWVTKEEALELEPSQMWSAGVVIKDTDDHITLAATIDPEGAFGNINVLPRGIIRSITALTPHQAPSSKANEPAEEPVLRDAGLA